MIIQTVVKGSLCVLLMTVATIALAQAEVSASWRYPEGGNLGGKSKSGTYMLHLPKEADNAMKAFHHALKRKDYATALAGCSEPVRVAGKSYPNAEAFITAVVPVGAISKLSRTPMSGQRQSFKEPGGGVIGVRCVVDVEELQWTWDIKKTESRWEIDFKPRQLKDWLDTVRNYYKRKEEVTKERREALLKHVSKVSTRLSVAKANVNVGEPVLLKLVLRNESVADLVYEDSQVGVNGSMTVVGGAGNTIEYSVPLVQTIMNPVDIKAGAQAVVLENLDVTKQYDMSKPGTYRIRFNGNGLSIGRRFAYKQFEIDYVEKEAGGRMYRKVEVGYAAEHFPSNTVTVTVKK